MHALIELQMPTEANLQLHFLPAKILADEVAEVKKYFEIYSVRQNDFLENSLRGHLLLGESVQAPSGYKSVVLQDSRGAHRKLKIKGCFQDFTYWNYDRSPKQANVYKQALQALHISEVTERLFPTNASLKYYYTIDDELISTTSGITKLQKSFLFCMYRKEKVELKRTQSESIG
ncbi:uncharacterized protein LOC119633870 isoform X1 [Glossina fuscipes]|uniref:Uncharacterized protein LOC119633870 isoform X1 n=1 Tax=Glossina fuscipes TaxID=7396 RepID=A0A8U0WEV3_9MUSC|nr:uncharacterized protein LOC119633870 isoform X1 [Glossina fuscipes]